MLAIRRELRIVVCALCIAQKRFLQGRQVELIDLPLVVTAALEDQLGAVWRVEGVQVLRRIAGQTTFRAIGDIELVQIPVTRADRLVDDLGAIWRQTGSMSVAEAFLVMRCKSLPSEPTT